MELTIKRAGESERRQGIDRLVSTVGFGDGCDVVLAPAGRTERLGMFIQQGEGLSFRPLHSPSGVFLQGIEIEGMVVLEEGKVLRILDYDLIWRRIQSPSEEFKAWAPQKVSLDNFVRPAGNRAGAMNAYGGFKSSSSNTDHDGVDVQLSEHALSGRSEKTGEERQWNSAEDDLRKRLEKVRQQALPLAPQRSAKEYTQNLESPLEEQKSAQSGIYQNNSLKSADKKRIPSGKSKDVLKHFFNHLEIDIFWRGSTERKMALLEGLRNALSEVMGEDDSSPLFFKFEKELKSPGPLKKHISDPKVCGIMIRDKGLLYIDRGNGFEQPELSFFNAAHAYWTMDRLLLSSGIRMDWRGGKKSFSLDRDWGGRVILPETSWQGAYVVMRRRKEERQNFTMEKDMLLNLAQKVKSRENLLLVAPDRASAQHLSFWFLKQAESLGAILVLSKKDHAETGDFPRRIGVRRGEEELYEWLDWSEDMDLAGILHSDPFQNGFELVRRLTYQRHGWWQVVVATDASAALERMELDLSLEKPDVSIDIHKRLLKGAFGAILSMGAKSISGRRSHLVIEVPKIDVEGNWGLSANTVPEEDWS